MTDELYNYLMYNIKRDIANLKGFVNLGNELSRMKRLEKYRDELILIKERGCSS